MKKNIYLGFLCLLVFLQGQAQSSISWSMEMNLAPSSSGNEHPRIVMDGHGNPLVVWHHASRCMFSRWNGSGFTTPVMINPPTVTVAGASWMGPDLAAHGDTVYIVYKQTPESSADAHIFCVRSFDGGVTFFPAVRVDYIADSLSRFPTVTTDDAGHPIIGFMKFDAGFGDSRWVVTRSADAGSTFLPDQKASGWSDPDAVICDCCPGSLASAGNTVAMLYRDNNSNIRDTWAGISTDNGYTFSGGINVDQQNWQIFACPSTGPDGVMLGDTLYSTFASAASGKSLVYFNKTAISTMSNPVSSPVTSLVAGLSQQNFPRIATDGKALAVAWVQVLSGSRQCVLLFTSDIHKGLPTTYEVVDLNDNTNCDVAVANGKIYVVWQNDNTGVIQYKAGTYTPLSGAGEYSDKQVVSIFPNPTQGTAMVSSSRNIDKILLVNALGETIYQASPNTRSFPLYVDTPGLYFLTTTIDQQPVVLKLLVTGSVRR